MNKLYLFLVIIVTCYAAQSFNLKKDDPTSEAIDSINQSYKDGLSSLMNEVEQYEKMVSQLKDSESILLLKSQHLQTRLAFKTIEYLLEYLDPQAVKLSINGAPLPKTEQKVADLRIIQPKGLQTLDEIVFSDGVLESKEEISKLISKLKTALIPMNNYHKGITITHRQVFEAARQGLVRVFTLGVTGFDTPGSVNAIPEAAEVMASINKDISSYLPAIKTHNSSLANSISAAFNGAISFLENNQDFDSFDRLHFLKEYINPLYKDLLQAHHTLQVETWEEVGLPPAAVNYESVNLFASDFLQPSYYSNLQSHELKEKRKSLGERLFYDTILSQNNNMSCASCHNPSKAFTDGLPKSLANNGKETVLRNSPTLINAVYSEKYFYDLRESIFEKQMSHVIHDPLEFNNDFISLIDKLEKDVEYKTLFEEAYPNEGVSKHGIGNSLANYVESLVSFNSPFDQYVRGERESITASVKRGFNVFMGKGACGTCHFAPTFNGLVPPLYQESESEVLGVPATPDTINPQLDSDPGRIANAKPLDEVEFYRHSFKTVTTRNVGYTAPYMHNGVYNSLEEVVTFYNNGGGAGMGMDLPYQTLPFDSLSLSAQEQKDLIVFMESLDDTSINAFLPN